MSDRYRIIKKIGQGGAGAVYLAEDASLGRRVAIKKLKAASGEENEEGSATSTASTPESLFQEAKALSALQHPNIVTVFDIVEEAEGPFVVMEYLSGETLEKTARKAPLPLADFFKIGIESLEALSAAHRQGILHRDIKPSNLMLVWDDSGLYRVKILDFGLAKFSREPSMQTEDQSGSILGTIHFMAPEQFERRLLDQRTDLYSLGCVLYRTLTQKYPFDGESGPEVMAAHLQNRHHPLDALRKDLPSEVVSWVECMMARLPEDRFSGSEEALTELQALQGRFLEGTLNEPVSSDSPVGASSDQVPLQPVSEDTSSQGGQATDEVLLPTVRLKPPSPPKSRSFTGIGWIIASALAVLSVVGFIVFQQELTTTLSASDSGELLASESDDLPREPAAVSPFAVDEIEASKGQRITVKGVIEQVRESRSGKTRYLNFSWPPGDSVPLAVSVTPANDSEFSMDRLEALSGKSVRASGEVESVFGNLQLKLLSWADLEVEK